ncbi:conjugal transfer protein TrbH [Pseudomonas helleri]|uniref:conjugal transfer protein TrbH n=1 Tax=Pseudomonas helleri TaxID=1608996 RepID=UPI003FD4D49E
MKTFLIFAFVIILGGCASNSPYGNYSSAPSTYNKKMADDTVSHLVTMYPPALTLLNIKQPTEDAYGTALIDLLRSRGYAVSEYSADNQNNASTNLPIPVNAGLDLHYVVDSLAPTVNIYRIMILLGNQTISRAYIPQNNGTVAAAGSWTHKE